MYLSSKSAGELEGLVRERTAQLLSANEALQAEISLRKQVEKAHRKAEQKYRSIFENAVEGIFQTTPDGRYVDVNPALAQIYGYDSPRDLIRSVTRIDSQIYVDPFRRAEFKRLMEEEGEVHDFEYEALRRDKKRIWVSQSARVVRGEAGEVRYFEGTTVDITRRKRAEEALKKSEEDYRSIFEHAVEGICRSTKEGRFLKVNPALVKMLGYESEHELLQIDIPTQLYLNPEDRVQFKKQIAHSGSLTHYELRLKKKNGEPIYANVHDRVHNDEKGEFLYYEAIIEDITERKRSEEVLQRAHGELELRVKERTAALRESQERYRTLVELSPESIAVYSGRKILYVNTACLAFVGVQKREELIGKDLSLLFQSHAGDTVGHLIDRIEYQKSGTLIQEKLLSADDSFVYIEISSAPISYLGQPARLVVMRDITERKWAEEKLLVYQQQLQSMASELALVQEEERRKMATYLHDNIGQALAVSKIKLKGLRAIASSDQLLDWIDQILDLTELAIQETRSLTLDLSPPILYELGFEAAVEWLAEREAEKHGLQIVCEDDRKEKPLADDIRVVLFQAVRELLLNVAKHARASIVRVTIAKRGESIQIDVVDDGVGFDTSALHSYNRKQGGFGLFNVRERLKHLGGSLNVQSGTEGLTRVTLFAPLKSRSPHHSVETSWQ